VRFWNVFSQGVSLSPATVARTGLVGNPANPNATFSIENPPSGFGTPNVRIPAPTDPAIQSHKIGLGRLWNPTLAAKNAARMGYPPLTRGLEKSPEWRATRQEFRDKMTALRSPPVTSKLAAYRVAPAGAPPNSSVIRASKASKRGSPCKCLSRGSRAK